MWSNKSSNIPDKMIFIVITNFDGSRRHATLESFYEQLDDYQLSFLSTMEPGESFEDVDNDITYYREHSWKSNSFKAPSEEIPGWI